MKNLSSQDKVVSPRQPSMNFQNMFLKENRSIISLQRPLLNSSGIGPQIKTSKSRGGCSSTIINADLIDDLDCIFAEVGSNTQNRSSKTRPSKPPKNQAAFNKPVEPSNNVVSDRSQNIFQKQSLKEE